MDKITTLLQSLALSSMLSTGVYADATIVGSIPYTLKQRQENSITATTNKTIQLLKVELSNEEKAALLQQSQDALQHKKQFSLNASGDHSDLPTKVLLGMSDVPVLDQGQHGTCVTFALTGAMDALLNKGDYVSQLCNLQLGSYLYEHGHAEMSGWDGAWPINIINQIEQYGVVSKAKQHKKGCGGMYHYPTSSNHNSSMEPEKFSALSEPMFGKVMNWSELKVKDHGLLTLDNVKDALNSGNRVIFAVLLPRVDLGTAGAVGKRNTWIFQDTWVLTPTILEDVPYASSAHEMIITGYDDKAVAVDDDGVKHKGLLILRNSWSKWAGDWGDFYMSYDYFKLLALDVKSIVPN